MRVCWLLDTKMARSKCGSALPLTNSPQLSHPTSHLLLFLHSLHTNHHHNDHDAEDAAHQWPAHECDHCALTLHRIAAALFRRRRGYVHSEKGEGWEGVRGGEEGWGGVRRGKEGWGASEMWWGDYWLLWRANSMLGREWLIFKTLAHPTFFQPNWSHFHDQETRWWLGAMTALTLPDWDFRMLMYVQRDCPQPNN